MSGKCYSCWGTFGLFNKELGCRNCGYSFCKKCLTKKAVIHKTSGEECLVCNRCYEVLSGISQQTKSPNDFEPPQALSRRIAEGKIAAQNREKRSLEQRTKKEIKNKDEELIARLANLKGKNCDSRKAPSEEEIEQWLKNAKDARGCSKDTPESKKVLKKDEVDDLLDEILNEVYLDNSLSMDGKISDGGRQQNVVNVDDLIKKTMHEVDLEENVLKKQNEEDDEISHRLANLKKEAGKGKMDSSTIIKDLTKKWELECGESEEEKWCCICNEDTEFQCLECDGDLYCIQCFNKGHKNIVEKHSLVPLKKD